MSNLTDILDHKHKLYERIKISLASILYISFITPSWFLFFFAFFYYKKWTDSYYVFYMFITFIALFLSILYGLYHENYFLHQKELYGNKKEDCTPFLIKVIILFLAFYGGTVGASLFIEQNIFFLYLMAMYGFLNIFTLLGTLMYLVYFIKRNGWL